MGAAPRPEGSPPRPDRPDPATGRGRKRTRAIFQQPLQTSLHTCTTPPPHHPDWASKGRSSHIKSYRGSCVKMR
ncbi:hypothetical protein Y1Q_0009600 [Alligator mississippiensis]|uniref:Uncharacterized protein n=1 Tax=Alligator mississippiensis TaxID=8496 RepID=A0A151NUZ9_ALLMI|nr:hypothetical protein Y1Q_0009600 [Alligator mississippiensis]